MVAAGLAMVIVAVAAALVEDVPRDRNTRVTVSKRCALPLDHGYMPFRSLTTA